MHNNGNYYLRWLGLTRCTLGIKRSEFHQMPSSLQLEVAKLTWLRKKHRKFNKSNNNIKPGSYYPERYDCLRFAVRLWRAGIYLKDNPRLESACYRNRIYTGRLLFKNCRRWWQIKILRDVILAYELLKHATGFTEGSQTKTDPNSIRAEIFDLARRHRKYKQTNPQQPKGSVSCLPNQQT
jgi:hypothetical protein